MRGTTSRRMMHQDLPAVIQRHDPAGEPPDREISATCVEIIEPDEPNLIAIVGNGDEPGTNGEWIQAKKHAAIGIEEMR